MAVRLSENDYVMYDDTPVGARLAGWLLLGIGGLVLAPIAFVGQHRWLLALALPFGGCGWLLLQTHMRIALDRRTHHIEVSHGLLWLTLSRRRFAPSDLAGVEVHRVGGDRLERDSDTWYVQLLFRTRTYTLGRYTDHMDALQARHELMERLQSLKAIPTMAEAHHRAESDLQQQPDSPQNHYQLGLALTRAGKRVEARQAFDRALALSSDNPLLVRMIRQRIEELDRG